jgi:uncharacterized protein (UPF0332 family)
MTDKLSKNDRSELILFYIEKAKNVLQEADCLSANAHYNGAVNRLYYACFYAARAILLSRKIESVTHNGVNKMLGLHFFRTDEIDKDFSVFYGQLFNARQEGDYEDFIYYTAKTFADFRPQAEAFIATIEELLKQEDMQ